MHLHRWLMALFLTSGWAMAAAQTVSISGSLGDKALLIIDGAARTVAVGASSQGVKLVSVSGQDAVVEVKGQRVSLSMGGAQVNLGGAVAPDAGTQVVLTAGSGGHFVSTGAINGKAVQFLVDTGASTVTLSESEAKQLGLDYVSSGKKVPVNTANGQVLAHLVRLAEVRVGDVQVYDVEATVLPNDMGIVLLGNSFLTRFQMRRDNDTMTLTKRF
jgi:aspartyl protease family protein